MHPENMLNQNIDDRKSAPEAALNSVDILQAPARVKEYVPVGLHSQPGNDVAAYAKCRKEPDGSVWIGPFDLTPRQIDYWIKNTSDQEMAVLIQTKQLRMSTASAIRSPQMRSVLSALESGQQVNQAAIKQVIPGDLQRVIAIKLRG